MSSQITAAAVSMPSNIAEGSSRSSERDYARFIEISLGSSFEFNTQLIIADALKYGNQTLRETLLGEIELENRMIQSFSHYRATFTDLFSLITVTLIWPV